MTDRPVTPTPDRRVWSERLVRISGFRRFLPTRASQRPFPFLVLVITLGIVVGLTIVLRGVIENAEKRFFEQSVDGAKQEVERRVGAPVGILLAVSSLSMADQASYRGAFQDFLSHANMQSPGIQSIGLCERIDARDRQQVKKRLEKEYGPPIRLQPEDPPRSEWYPIVHVEPLLPNRWALGWDLFTEVRVRNPAMERARDSGKPSATRRVAQPGRATLERGDTGFYVFMPVYKEGAPTATPVERQAAIQGFTYCWFRLSDLFNGILGSENKPPIVFRVYDSPETRAEDLVYSPETEVPGYPPRLTARRTIEVYGVPWTIEFFTQPEFDQTFSRWLVPWTFFGGVVCSLLLFFATFALVHARMDAERIEGILREKSAELARSNTDLERFAYVASHDLREPLRMVTSYVQLLEKRYSDKLDDSAREFIAFAVDGAKRMNEFLDGLLHLSRVVRDPGVHDPTDAQRVLRSALDNLKHTIESNAAQVTSDPLPAARINELHLLQLFQNLVGNAIKFQRNGAPRVHVSATRDGDFVRFSVRDNGIGIDPQFTDQVFDLFRRYHTRDQYPGSGVGLAICKRIVEQRGGRIWFDSKPDQGTTFYFTLPAG
jgi:signal transduction histidine kinase